MMKFGLTLKRDMEREANVDSLQLKKRGQRTIENEMDRFT